MNTIFRPSDFGQEVKAGDSLGDAVVVVALVFAAVVMIAL